MVTLWLAAVTASASVTGAHPWAVSRVTAAIAAAPIAVAVLALAGHLFRPAPPRLGAQVQHFRCVTLRQDTGSGSRVWRARTGCLRPRGTRLGLPTWQVPIPLMRSP